MNRRLGIAIGLSIVVHGAAYGALLRVRPNLETETRRWEVYKEKEKKKVEFKPVEKPKPRKPPPPRPEPEQPKQRPKRQPPRQAEEKPPQKILDLTKAGLSEHSFGGDGIAVPLGDTTLGDPDIEPPKVPKISAPEPEKKPEPKPKPKQREKITVKTLPRPVNVPVLPYPDAARRRGIQGTVVLEVTIGEDGKVIEVKVLKGLGHGLDEVARKALMQARFKPAVGSDGNPMPHKIRYRYTFRLEDSDGF